MKIGGTRSTGRPATVRTRPTSGAAGIAPSQASGPSTPIADLTTVAGIPEGDLTPKVRAAIEMLMAEVQRLRVDIDQAQQRVGYLEKLADEDSLVPVANRRAFVRELGRIVAYAERYGTESSVLYFDINSFKDQRIRDWAKNLKLLERYTADVENFPSSESKGAPMKDWPAWFSVLHRDAVLKSPRRRYIVSIQVLLYALSSVSETEMPQPIF